MIEINFLFFSLAKAVRPTFPMTYNKSIIKDCKIERPTDIQANRFHIDLYYLNVYRYYIATS